MADVTIEDRLTELEKAVSETRSEVVALSEAVSSLKDLTAHVGNLVEAVRAQPTINISQADIADLVVRVHNLEGQVRRIRAG